MTFPQHMHISIAIYMIFCVYTMHACILLLYIGVTTFAVLKAKEKYDMIAEVYGDCFKQLNEYLS